MAKSKYKIADIESMSADEITHLPEKELREVIGVMRDVIAKREKRLESKGYNTPALEGLHRSGGAITTKGKVYDEHGRAGSNTLQGEAIRAFTQIKAKTSTITGFEDAIKQFSEQHGYTGDNAMTEEQYTDMWRLVNKMDALAKINKTLGMAWYGLSSDRIIQLATRIIMDKKMSADEYIKTVTDKLNELENQVDAGHMSKADMEWQISNFIWDEVEEE